MISPLAGKVAPKDILINHGDLVGKFYSIKPNASDQSQLVSFGTSGHRGTSINGSFNQPHIQAITQAVCEYRSLQGITGPLFMGMDTHALSMPAQNTTIEILAGNKVKFRIQQDNGFTPTPVISYAILAHNRGQKDGLADGIVITPSHNPPSDGGFKYNPPNGGPADTDATGWIQNRANELLRAGNNGIKTKAYEDAIIPSILHPHDFMMPYINDLGAVVDMAAIARSGIKIMADAMGGAGFAYWNPIAEKYGLNIKTRNAVSDPTFSFMTVDHDGKIRMDCSSPFAMASLVALKDEKGIDIAFGNDTDFDRHGIVTKDGLMNPNHYLAVAIWYLFQNRPQWSPSAGIGKTLVSSSMIDRIAKHLNRNLVEVPVGFKWFVPGLLDGSLGFGGEESAGAAFLRRDGTTWVTEKDGFIMDLLAAEILARTGKSPSEIYRELTGMFGEPIYKRIDAAANGRQK
ncbi:MAG: phosphoglucomutase, alpha-D-glucose phosphate-specific, partial [bacterium]